MRNALPTTGLIAHTKALEAAQRTLGVVAALQPALGRRASQVVIAERGRLWPQPDEGGSRCAERTSNPPFERPHGWGDAGPPKADQKAGDERTRVSDRFRTRRRRDTTLPGLKCYPPPMKAATRNRLILGVVLAVAGAILAYNMFFALTPPRHADHDHAIAKLDAGGFLWVEATDGKRRNLVGVPDKVLVLHWFDPLNVESQRADRRPPDSPPASPRTRWSISSSSPRRRRGKASRPPRREPEFRRISSTSTPTARPEISAGCAGSRRPWSTIPRGSWLTRRGGRSTGRRLHGGADQPGQRRRRRDPLKFCRAEPTVLPGRISNEDCFPSHGEPQRS